MDLQHALWAIARWDGPLPRDAMVFLREHWDECVATILDRLDRYVSGEDRSEAVQESLLPIIYLLAEKGETRAFPSLCGLLLLGDLTEIVLGDALTQDVPSILISTFDGDEALLRSVVEHEEADEWVRSMALAAMAYLGGSGRLRHTEIEGFLSQLSERPEPPESYFWAMWGTSVALLGLERLADQVEAAIADGRIDPLSLTSDQFQKLLQQAIDDPSRTAGFHADRIGPFGDAIAALALWYGPGTASTSAIRTGVPISAPTPEKVKIGRNDRCPCGNGKKYKHCCLKNG